MKSPQLNRRAGFLLAAFGWCALQSSRAENPDLFDLPAIRDPSTLEVEVLQDWKASAKEPEILQKLVEITVCEWWPGQKVRLPVTLNVPVGGAPCENVIVANQGLSNRVALPSGGSLDLLKERGVGVVLIGMGTIDAMEPAGTLHVGMREHLLATRDVRYTPAWIWGMSQMRALTVAMTEPGKFQPRKVLTTGGSKRGVAAAVAGIHDNRFTAILPVVAPPLGNPGSPTYVIGREPAELGEIDAQFYEELAAGKLGLSPDAASALKDRAARRARQRITLDQARAADWSEQDLATITDRAWNACRVANSWDPLKTRGLEIFYLVGTNDSVTPSLLELGERFPQFPICIIPGGQHGGPATAGYTRRTPLLPAIQQNLTAFARHHFFAEGSAPYTPKLSHEWLPESRTFRVTVNFENEREPRHNTLWWNRDRSEPYTLPYEYDHWDSIEMTQTGPSQYEAEVKLNQPPHRLDFITLHSGTGEDPSLTISSPYRRFSFEP